MAGNRSKYLFKNIGILTISNFASKFLVFLLVPLYTSVLSTEEYGGYDFVYSTIQLLFPILTLNISDAVMRFAMDKEKNSDDVVTIGFRILLKSILPIILFFIGCLYGGWIGAIRGYEILILLYFIFYFFYQYLIQMAKGLEKVVDMGIAGILSTIFLLGLNLLFLLVFHMGLLGFYIANVVAQGVPVAYLLVRVRIWRFPILNKIDKSLQKEMLNYCLPLVVTVLWWWVNNTADKYTVTFLRGASANGLLSVSYKMPSIINVVQNVFIQAWQISAIKEYDSGDKEVFYGKYFYAFSVMMSVTCSWLIILTKPISHIMYAKDFYAAWEFVPFLLIASVINSAAGFLGPILAAKKDSKAMALSALYGASVNIFLNIALVYFIGIQGATIATVISSFVMYITRKRAVGTEIRLENYKTVLATWFLLISQAILEIYTSFWWAEILIMGLMLFINWKGLKVILQFVKSFITRKG